MRRESDDVLAAEELGLYPQAALWKPPKSSESLLLIVLVVSQTISRSESYVRVLFLLPNFNPDLTSIYSSCAGLSLLSLEPFVKRWSGANNMAQQVKKLAAKIDHLSSIPHGVRRKLLQVVLWPPHMCHDINEPPN